MAGRRASRSAAAANDTSGGYTVIMNDLEDRFARQFIDAVACCSGPPHAWARDTLIEKLGGTFKVAFELPYKWKKTGVKVILKVPFTGQKGGTKDVFAVWYPDL